MWSIAAAVLLVNQVAATPAFYNDRHNGCAVPSQSFKGHGAPVETADIELSIATAEGEPVLTWTPGTTYTITTSAYPGSGGNVYIWMHMTDGVPDAGNGALADACMGTAAAWYAQKRASDATVIWTAPAAGAAGTCVTVSVAQAKGSLDAFKINSAEFCVGDGAVVPASASSPPGNAAGRQPWGLAAVVSSAALFVVAMMAELI